MSGTKCVDEIGGGDGYKNSLNGLSKFAVKRLLNEDTASKKLCVEGTFEDKQGSAVIIFEQKLISEEYTKNLLARKPFIKEVSKNDIYGTFECWPNNELNALDATIIYPASEDDIKKNESQYTYLIEETSDLYAAITLPYISQESLNLQWVYDILDHKTEQEKIIFEHLHPEEGFILLPHLQWDQKDIGQLHLISIVRPYNIKSLRDLTARHIPLLKNIDSKISKFIEEKYGIYKSRLVAFLHYQPSYYHLHIHFVNISCEFSGRSVEEAHLLTDVITNIELMPDYYQRATLSFVVSEIDNLFMTYKSKGLLKLENKEVMKSENLEEKTSSEV